LVANACQTAIAFEMELGHHFSWSRSTRRKEAKAIWVDWTPTAEDLVVAKDPGAWMVSLTRLTRPPTLLPIDF
jgi:hypothetical protein